MIFEIISIQDLFFNFTYDRITFVSFDLNGGGEFERWSMDSKHSSYNICSFNNTYRVIAIW